MRLFETYSAGGRTRVDMGAVACGAQLVKKDLEQPKQSSPTQWVYDKKEKPHPYQHEQLLVRERETETRQE